MCTCNFGNILEGTKNIAKNIALQTVSVGVAGSIRRMRLPTPEFLAFAFIQSVVTNTVLEGIKWTERKCGMVKDPETDKTIALANYILSQVISIGLTYLVVQNLAVVGFAVLVYNMNPPSLSPYDFGSIFCIVAQSTLVTLFVKSMKDLYNEMNCCQQESEEDTVSSQV